MPGNPIGIDMEIDWRKSQNGIGPTSRKIGQDASDWSSLNINKKVVNVLFLNIIYVLTKPFILYYYTVTPLQLATICSILFTHRQRPDEFDNDTNLHS